MSPGLSMPTKPQRPLSAYNLFFRLERERILSIHNSQAQNEDSTETASMTGGSKISAEDVANISDEKRYGVVRRQDRKKHGKIGFAELAKLIAKKWKEISKSEKDLLQERAHEEKINYKKLLKEYSKNLREYEKQHRAAAATSPEENEAFESVPQKENSHRREFFSSGGDSKYFGHTPHQTENKALMDTHIPQQVVSDFYEEQQMDILQEQRWQEHVMQQQRALMMQQMLHQWDSHSHATKHLKVNSFDTKISLLGSNKGKKLIHQPPLHSCNDRSIEPTPQFFPKQVQQGQNQSELAFGEEEDNEEQQDCQAPTFDHWNTFSSCDHHQGAEKDTLIAYNHQQDSNASIMMDMLPLPIDTNPQTLWRLDQFEPYYFQE